MADKKQSQQDAIQDAVDQAEEQGFLGQKTDPRPNSAYSLESGPDSPSAAEATLDGLRAQTETLEATLSNKQ
jgi:hypothetical protein